MMRGRGRREKINYGDEAEEEIEKKENNGGERDIVTDTK